MPGFQSNINQAINTAAGIKIAAEQKKQKAARTMAQTAMTTQLQSLSQRIQEIEKAKAAKQKSRAWLDNILGGVENG